MNIRIGIVSFVALAACAARQPADTVARFNDPHHTVEIRSEFRQPEAYTLAYEPDRTGMVNPCGVPALVVDERPTLLTQAPGTGCVFVIPPPLMHDAAHGHRVEVRTAEWNVVATDDVRAEILRIHHQHHHLVHESTATAAQGGAAQ